MKKACRILFAVGACLIAAGVIASPAFAVQVPNETTTAATAIGETTVTLHGQVEPVSKASVVACQFEYLTESDWLANGEGFAGASTAPCAPSPPFSAPTNVTAAIEGLSPSTTYRFRLTASNSTATTSSSGRSFLTLGPPIFLVPSGSSCRFNLEGGFEHCAYRASAHSAELFGLVDPMGSESTCSVQLVDQSSFEQTGYTEASTDPCSPAVLPASNEFEPVEAVVSGLALDSTYHFRFLGTNGRGFSTGPDQTFSTYGISSFSFQDLDAFGEPETRAGTHPYLWMTSFSFNTEPIRFAGGNNEGPGAVGNVKDILTELPRGLIGDPTAVPTCSRYEVVQGLCPGASQVGKLDVDLTGPETQEVGLYNVAPPAGHPAYFGASVKHLGRVWIEPVVRTGGDYGITAEALDTSTEANVLGATVTLWGVPADPVHDPERRCPDGEGTESVKVPPCESGLAPPFKPFLTNPTACGGPLTANLRADSWQAIGDFDSASSELPVFTGCNQIQFEPAIEARPTTNVADSPSGVHVDIHVPQNDDAEGLATADLRDATVTLPSGLVVNPSSANGLGACTAGQIGLTSAPGATPVTYTSAAPDCPASARIGTVEVDSPLLNHPLPGSVYLAQPQQNPFGSLLAIYIVVDDPQSGVVVKLAGQVHADPETGQLTSTVEESPQLPFEDFKLDFFKGAGAPLRTPATCGPYATTSVLTPWSAPESGPPAAPADHYEVSQGAGGGSCPSSAAAEPNHPSFEAGTESPLAGAYSPFVLKLHREDGSQELGGLSVDLPQGLLGKLAGVAECPESGLALASSREHEGGGAEELASPSCPAASEVGTVTVGAGAGPSPYYTGGKAYLAGPYKGAPLSLAIVTPAVAGPFDLGDVLVRTALQVNPYTATITAVSDPIPHILDGIPLDVRSIALTMDRPQFTLNPTNCEAKQISGTATTVLGQSAPLANRFQVGGCKSLGFNPKLSLSLKGPTRRSANPMLKAVLTYPKGSYANVAYAQVGLPGTEFLDQGNLDHVCTQPELASRSCPAGSIYGFAKAWTPLLDKPLEGPVYLGVGFGHKLPDLVAELNGQIRVLLHAKIDEDSERGLRSTFEVVPDAPVSRFVLTMKGGPKYGLLENTEGVCAKPQRAFVKLIGQNGKVQQYRQKIQNGCGKGKKHGKGKKSRANLLALGW